ncbi:MAG: 4Fe-4S dicluster domain-containing protein, partial [Thiohalomonadales bacterium]
AKIGLSIDQMQCLNLRGRHISCTHCADSCAANALQLTADAIQLDTGRCTACGACLPACPSGAITLGEFDPQQFLQSVAGIAELHIHCSRSEHSDVQNRVACLQLLDARLLAAAAANGTHTVVLHGSHQCTSCVRGDAHAAIERMHSVIKKWFTHAPVQLLQAQSPQSETAQPQVQLDRRSFLRLATAQVTQDASAWIADKIPTSQAATPRWPLFEKDAITYRPSAYQQLLAERAGSLPWRERQFPWRSRIFSERCSGCLSCTQYCPTGALTAHQTQTTVSIDFQLRLCTDCDLCIRLCPENAIACSTTEDAAELHAPARRVMQRSLRKCVSCAHSFVAGPSCAERCTTCQNEYAIANDWKTMLTD